MQLLRHVRDHALATLSWRTLAASAAVLLAVMAAAAPSASVSGSSMESEVAPPPVAAPSRIRIDRLRVDASIIPVGLEANGAMGIPSRAGDVAWFAPGPAPGAAGNAIVAGHYDWYGVRGVFFRLNELRPGDRIQVQQVDGSSVWFVVRESHWFGANDSPEAVFASTTVPTLTLVTCGGAFDRLTGTYDQRLVVIAVGERAVPG